MNGEQLIAKRVPVYITRHISARGYCIFERKAQGGAELFADAHGDWDG
jgi:hypothetical protein